VEWSLEEYRGQVRDYGGCFSGFDRCKTEADLFDALLRNGIFEQALQHHPVILRMQSVTLFNKPFCIDKQGVAQHYGLATEYVDITPNFDVASFFATQSWNDKLKRYEPMKTNIKPGVIFKMHPVFAMLPQDGKPPPYTPVGWQPFERPEQQRANAFRVEVGQDFAKQAAKFRFKHNWQESKRIYEQFEGGDLLFPTDSLAEFAETVKSLTEFSQAQVNKAIAKFSERTGKPLDQATAQAWLKQKGNKIAEDDTGLNQYYNWNFDHQAFEEKLKALGNRIRVRMTAPHYQG
jgi:hypothetical protein